MIICREFEKVKRLRAAPHEVSREASVARIEHSEIRGTDCQINLRSTHDSGIKNPVFRYALSGLATLANNGIFRLLFELFRSSLIAFRVLYFINFFIYFMFSI